VAAERKNGRGGKGVDEKRGERRKVRSRKGKGRRMVASENV